METSNQCVQMYQGTQISFELGNNVMVNLTDVFKAFPTKNLTNIINSQEIKEYCDAFSKLQNYSLADLVQVNRGGNNPGTWAHQKVALRVAQKLSPEFAVWVDTKLEELLTAGVTTVSNDDEVIAQALSLLQRRLDAKQQRVQILEHTVEHQNDEIKILVPKAKYTDEVLQSTSTYTFTQVAHDLGLKSVHVLTTWLKSKSLIFKQSGQWQPTHKVADKGYFKTRTYSQSITEQTSRTIIYTVVTEIGRAWIHDIYKKNN